VEIACEICNNLSHPVSAGNPYHGVSSTVQQPRKATDRRRSVRQEAGSAIASTIESSLSSDGPYPRLAEALERFRNGECWAGFWPMFQDMGFASTQRLARLAMRAAIRSMAHAGRSWAEETTAAVHCDLYDASYERWSVRKEVFEMTRAEGLVLHPAVRRHIWDALFFIEPRNFPEAAEEVRMLLAHDIVPSPEDAAEISAQAASTLAFHHMHAQLAAALQDALLHFQRLTCSTPRAARARAGM
jgi:hypothetical protein